LGPAEGVLKRSLIPVVLRRQQQMPFHVTLAVINTADGQTPTRLLFCETILQTITIRVWFARICFDLLIMLSFTTTPLKFFVRTSKS